jgi:biotin-(acetyl-CoA carboxylase) ligase
MWASSTADSEIGEVKELIGDRRVYVIGDLTAKGYPRHGRMWNSNPGANPYTWGVLKCGGRRPGVGG